MVFRRVNNSEVLCHSEGIERVELDDGVVLEHDGRVHVLNVTAKEIFDLVDGSRARDTFVQAMCSAHGTEEMRETVLKIIRQLMQLQLIHESNLL